MRLAALLLLACLLVACGGDEEADPTATAAAGASQALPGGGEGAIFIPAIGVGAPLTPKRLVPGQALPSPDGSADVAIYDFGPELPGLGGAPGQGGNIVLSGLNLAVEGCISGEPPCDAVFRRLRRVPPGAEVELQWQAQSYAYQVVSICVVPAMQFGDGLYRRTAEEQLTLLTGAGNWSSESGWSHVLIVIAKPAPRTALEACPAGTQNAGG